MLMFKKLFRVQICKLEQRVCGDEFPGAPSRPYNPYPAPRPPPKLDNKDNDRNTNIAKGTTDPRVEFILPK